MKRRQPCGTAAAYRWHKRHGQEPCPEDVEAYRVADRGWDRRWRRPRVVRPPLRVRACRGGCGQTGMHREPWLCDACRKRWVKAGRPDEVPPPRMRRLWRKEDYAELTRDLGESLYSAAERMGISVRTAWRYEAELRAAEAGVTERRAA